ncbi:hypothetical protein F5888DRAFT_160250 [Russula emetica]|nr:hypothetical protein F5888DRAFT_160250 [Russula emetica]
MPTPVTPSLSPLTVESDTTSSSASSGDVFVAPDTRRPAAYIELPHLAPEERVKYEAVSNRDLPQDFDYDLPLSDRVIIGEYRDNTALWYYVENADGIAHRFEAFAFAEAFPYSVSEYKYRKTIGALPAFDPSASNVYPDSRAKVFIRISMKKRRKLRRLSKQQALSVGSFSDEEWEGDVAEGDDVGDLTDDDDIWGLASSSPPRGIKRPTIKGRRGRPDLPFSPKKFMRTLSESESSETNVRGGVDRTRRSNRIRNSRGTNKMDRDYEDGESDSLSDEYVPVRNSRSKGKINTPKRGKASRAAYGHIRSIADLEYDELENGPLSAHRDTCERCQRKPTHILLEQQRKKGKVKRKPKDEFEEDSGDEDKLASLGGWVRCLKCPLAAHWRCLAGTQRDEILKAVQARDLGAQNAARGKDVVDTTHMDVDGSKSMDSLTRLPPKRPGLESHQTTEFICSMCLKGGVCMGCKNVALEPESLGTQKSEDKVPRSGSVTVTGGEPALPNGTDTLSKQSPSIGGQCNNLAMPPKELLFRCRLCKRLAHYAHLASDRLMKDSAEDVDVEATAEYYQRDQDWSCADCVSFVYRVEKILAWRPYPANAPQPELPHGESISPRMYLPREYLVKWQDRSYRRVQWVPHGWLASVHSGLLRNFLLHGPKVELLEHAVREDQIANAASEGGIGRSNKESDESRPKAGGSSEDVALLPSLDAERRIPPAWKTVDRVLDVLIWSPREQRSKANKKMATRKEKMASADPAATSDAQKEWDEAFGLGEVPSAQNTRTVDQWEDDKEDELSVDDIDRVVWAFIKWDDLGYDEATWDSPPRQDEPGYSAFKVAFEHFLDSRRVHIKLRNKKEIETFERRRKNEFRQKYASEKDQQPDLGQQERLKLMPFQIQGLYWLCDNWWNHQPCILADEMGLGKTIQIVTFIGNIIKEFDAAPVLVVVPHSTITNWSREFSSWAPGIRVVPFYGEAKSREVIKRYELRHPTKIQGTTGSKFHVLITTYDTITSKDFNTVIKSIPRWEVLIVDEGQRLKNDQGLLFKKLNELNVSHRIIMTGTPLNNNIRELFNLMNFLDPNEWNDLEQLEKDHEELTEDLVKELHNRLRPYFLRRLKGQVLQLPPKNEVIVPVSLTPLQKEVYKSVLGKNVEILKTLTSIFKNGENASKKLRTGNMNNILMELRKCIQHPYLVSHDIEPKGLSPLEAHSRLIAGSAKLRLLQALLPKLKARGHRVLLFSQFVIALDIIEDFLVGEGVPYLRLDGNTKQSERQKGMDEFNRQGSDIFIYLLSTRAGGVGINLWSADTVIIFDPDFNPHQDLQAIARAHRYGQTKPCLVFKLMAKDTAEERIIQTGKKKLVLDHVIVQKMDDGEGGGDVRSILTYGALALLDETATARDITYSDQDLDKLIEKTETEETPPKETGEDPGQAFSFAKVWTADNDALEELEDQALEHTAATDSWAHALELIAKEQTQTKAAERTGRGVRRKAAIAAENQQKLDFLDTPTKGKPQGKKRKKSESAVSDESDVYVNANLSQSENSSDEALGHEVRQDIAELGVPAVKGSVVKGYEPPKRLSQSTVDPVSRSTPTFASNSKPAHSPKVAVCAMCGNVHQGTCGLTQRSENLAQYRQLLFTEQSGESFEERRDAIAMIDDTLEKRGQLHLIHNQPLRLVEKVKSRVSGSTKADKRDNSKVLPTQSSSSRPKTASNRHSREGVKRDDSKVQPTQPSSSRPKTASDPHLRGAVLDREGVKRDNSKVLPTQPSSSRPKTASDPHLLISTSAGGWQNVTPAPRKRPSDTPDSAMKRQKTGKYPGCPICGGPHHLVKDCPITAEGPKSIRAAIVRLESQSGQTPTVAALRDVLKRHKERALG